MWVLSNVLRASFLPSHHTLSSSHCNYSFNCCLSEDWSSLGVVDALVSAVGSDFLGALVLGI